LPGHPAVKSQFIKGVISMADIFICPGPAGGFENLTT